MTKKRNRGHSSKWQKSVAQYLEDNGKVFIANENLDKKHVRIAKPELFKK
jgi:hypothetical protein